MPAPPGTCRTLLLLGFLAGVKGLAATAAQRTVPEEMRAAIVAGAPSQWKQCKLGSVTMRDCGAELDRYKVAVVPSPKPHFGTAVVKVMATSVNPHDWKMSMRPGGGRMGIDFAGVVVATGDPCGFSRGDRVMGLGGLEGDVTFAEYVEKDCWHLARIPAKLGFLEAGAMPAVVMTGRQGLREAGAPWRNSPTVLVLGGAGGTGHVGIQLAKAYGAGKVITTCSHNNFDFVKGLGADEAIDYHEHNWWEVLKPGSVDVIYDCISMPGTGEHAFQVLPDGGHFVTLLVESAASKATLAARPKVSQHYFVCWQTATGDWDEIARFVEAGKLRVSIERVYEGLEQVKDAYAANMGGHTRGKIALRVANETAASFLSKRGT